MLELRQVVGAFPVFPVFKRVRDFEEITYQLIKRPVTPNRASQDRLGAYRSSLRRFFSMTSPFWLEATSQRQGASWPVDPSEPTAAAVGKRRPLCPHVSLHIPLQHETLDTLTL